METLKPVLSAADRLRQELAPSLQLLRSRLRRRRTAVSVVQTLQYLTVGTPVVATIIFIGKNAGLARIGYWAGGGLALAVVGLLAVSAFRSSRRSRATHRDAAERLDLAIGGNRIATALDLAESEDASPFTRLAIASGLRTLADHKKTLPVLPATSFAPGPWGWGSAAGLTLVLLASIWPIAIGNVTIAAKDNDPVAAAIKAPTDESVLSASDREHRREPPQPTPSSPAPGLRQATPDEQAGPGDSTRTARASGRGDDTASAGAARATTADASASVESGASQTASASAMPASSGDTPTNTDRSSEPEAMQPRPAEARPTTPPSQAADAKAGAQSASTAANRSDSPNASRSGAQANAQSRASNGDPQSGSGQQNGNSARSQSSGESAGGTSAGQNGQGQGTGQSPPKKSRGVPPLMDGARLPDTLVGPQLAGPDERRIIRSPPSGQTDKAAAIGPVAPARPTEAAPAQSAVLPEGMSAVSSYFDRLHPSGPVAP